ncbi:MAG: 50S ribosomal protein L19e [Candidatus Micrarchaeota archaeon]
MGLATIKRLAADLMKCGESRVRILDAKKAEDALTREDVRKLIIERVVVKLPETGVGRGKARWKQSRKQAGRRRSRGSKKGSKYAGQSAKQRWMQKARAQRRLLRGLKQKISGAAYRKAYRMIKGSAFRTKKQLLGQVQEKSFAEGKTE